MRNYGLHQSAAFDDAPGLSFLLRLVRRWQARRQARGLLELDDHMLRDIGLARGDVMDAARLPLSENAMLALEATADVNRRLAQRHPAGAVEGCAIEPRRAA